MQNVWALWLHVTTACLPKQSDSAYHIERKWLFSFFLKVFKLTGCFLSHLKKIVYFSKLKLIIFI